MGCSRARYMSHPSITYQGHGAVVSESAGKRASRRELAIVASLQVVIIGAWVATWPHSFDLLTTLVGMTTRVIAVSCIVHGLRRYRPEQRLLWWILAGRLSWSIVFIPIRNLFISDWLWWQIDSAAGTLSYVVVAGLLVRSRAADRDRTLWIDVTVICLGMLFVMFSYLGIPLMESGSHNIEAVFTGVAFPCLDTILIALVLLLAYGSAKQRNSSLIFLLAAFTIVAAADLEALLHTLGAFNLTRTRTFAPLAFSFVGLIGLAALSPSMATLERNENTSLNSWDTSRVVLVVAAFLLTLFRFIGWTSRGAQPPPILVGTVLAVMFVLIVLRAFIAIRALATSHGRVMHMATHDGATGLLNLNGLKEAYERLSTRAPPGSVFSLILVRLRELREIGQLWGDSVRDELLGSSAATIAAASSADNLVARIGTDRFALLSATPGRNPDAVDRVAQSVADAVRSAPSYRSSGITPVFDIGVAGAHPNSTLDELLREAESAASVSQAHGNGSIARYDAVIAAKEARRYLLLNLLRGAVERNELRLVYQPVVDLATLQIVSHEALLRWSTAELGIISPNEFIPLAESSDTIENITDWVLDAACQTSASTTQGADNHYIAVNVSARSFERAGLSARVRSALVRHRLPTSAIGLEVTERSLTEDRHGELHALRTEGVRVAIDDFGTGYSNLATLTRLSASIIKLDMSLVHAAGSDLSLRRVIFSVLRPLKERGMNLVAEGIETVEQSSLMAELGCQCGQGWLYGRPTPELSLTLPQDQAANG